MNAAAVLRVTAGALIPSAATIIFNIMHFFFENYDKKPIPEISASTYDIGVGCAFSLIGICVTTKDHEESKNLLMLFVALILLLMLGGLIGPALWKWPPFYVTWILNFLSFTLLSWAILEAD